MYLWIGLGIDGAERIREYCKNANSVGVSEIAFTLPQHISLKSSFATEKYKEIIAYLKERYKALGRVTVTVSAVEKIPGVIWLRIEENAALRRLHNELNAELSERFGEGLTGFDGERFKFHSTLFYDPENETGLDELLPKIKALSPCGESILANRMYFGVSESGKAGEYRVVDFIELK